MSANSQKRTFIEREWFSELGQFTKIGLSDGSEGKPITMAVQFGYDRHGFEGYLGNIGPRGMNGGEAGRQPRKTPATQFLKAQPREAVQREVKHY